MNESVGLLGALRAPAEPLPPPTDPYLVVLTAIKVALERQANAVEGLLAIAERASR